MEENLILDGKSKKIPVLPIIFLLLVVISSGALFGYNKFVIGKEIEKISQNITSREEAIAKLKEDKKIIINELLEANKQEIERYERNSDIVKYMDHLEYIKKKYGISFSGFSISDGKLNTKVTARKVSIRGEKEPYEKVSDFIQKYRTDANAILELNFINSFEGMNNIEFDVNFSTKMLKKNDSEEKNSGTKNNLNDNSKTNE